MILSIEIFTAIVAAYIVIDVYELIKSRIKRLYKEENYKVEVINEMKNIVIKMKHNAIKKGNGMKEHYEIIEEIISFIENNEINE